MSKNKFFIQDDSGDRKYFTIIPNYILNHSSLWDREVYIQMKRIAGEDGTCWTSQKTLAKQCGISINRLKKSIHYLLEHKWIESIGKKDIETAGGNQEVNEYRIIDLWDKNNDFYQNRYKGVSSDDIPYTKGVSRINQRGVTAEAKGVSPGDDKEDHCLRRSLKEEPVSKDTEATPIINSGNKDINWLIEEFETIMGFKPAGSKDRFLAKHLLNNFSREQLSYMLKYCATNEFAPRIGSVEKLWYKRGDIIAGIKTIKNNKTIIV